MGMITGSIYRKIRDWIDCTYNCFLETGEIIEFH